MRFLGIDYGTKRIGLAVSDESALIATPLKIIEISKIDSALEKIRKVVLEKEIKAIVVGLPLKMNGEEGSAAKAVKKFAESLIQNLPDNIELHFSDERLSSKDADLMLSFLSRKKKKKRQDAVAASIFLQSFLDQIKDDKGQKK